MSNMEGEIDDRGVIQKAPPFFVKAGPFSSGMDGVLL
jgi:hypothetical protein